MMEQPVEVPHPRDLDELPIDVEYADPPDTDVYTTTWANDGSEVRVSWDEVTGSVGVGWWRDGRRVVHVSRETLRRISIEAVAGVVEFRILYGIERLRGELVVTVGDDVEISDGLLET